MSEVKFKTSKEDSKVIAFIVERAIRMDLMYGEKLDLIMDITACHCNGRKLKLDELLNADDFNFGHDISGIQNCIDRDTGGLTKCFLPRFSA